MLYCPICIALCRHDEELIKEFCTHLLNRRGYSKTTALTYRQELDQFVRFLFDRGLSLLEATRSDIEAHLEFMQAMDNCSRTVARRLSALRTFYRRLLKNNRIGGNPTAFLRVKKNWSNNPRSRPKEFVADTLNKAYDDALNVVCGTQASQIAIRNWAIKEFMYGSAARRDECRRVDVSNVSMRNLTVHLNGKGDKDRMASITEAARDALKIYLESSRPKLLERSKEGQPSQALFLSKFGTRVSLSTLNEITKGLSPHEYRHSHAQHSVDGGAPLSHVQLQLGHTFLQTTVIYAGDLSFDQKMEAHQRYHPRRRNRSNEGRSDQDEG